MIAAGVAKVSHVDTIFVLVVVTKGYGVPAGEFQASY